MLLEFSPRSGLSRLLRRAHKVAQHGHIRPIHSNASRIDGQSEPLRQVEIHSRIIQFRQAVTCRRQHAVHTRRIHRPRWTVAPPRSTRQLVILLPIPFVPRRHLALLYVFFFRLDASRAHKVLFEISQHRSSHFAAASLRSVALPPGRQALTILHIPLGASFSSPIVSNTLPGYLFRGFLFSTAPCDVRLRTERGTPFWSRHTINISPVTPLENSARIQPFRVRTRFSQTGRRSALLRSEQHALLTVSSAPSDTPRLSVRPQLLASRRTSAHIVARKFLKFDKRICKNECEDSRRTKRGAKSPPQAQAPVASPTHVRATRLAQTAVERPV